MNGRAISASRPAITSHTICHREIVASQTVATMPPEVAHLPPSVARELIKGEIRLAPTLRWYRFRLTRKGLIHAGDPLPCKTIAAIRLLANGSRLSTAQHLVPRAARRLNSTPRSMSRSSNGEHRTAPDTETGARVTQNRAVGDCLLVCPSAHSEITQRLPTVHSGNRGRWRPFGMVQYLRRRRLSSGDHILRSSPSAVSVVRTHRTRSMPIETNTTEQGPWTDQASP